MSERKGLGWREWAFLAEAAAQIGCLTLVVILLALGAGLWLDSRLGTKPWFTLGLVLASIPVSLYLVVRLALSAARRAYPPEKQGSKEAGERGSGEAEEEGMNN
ncbi:MAG: AtpZ/AtpI family protein [Anaerolineae bacterium]|nr:AtpZ/AtpI family protein [Anaerolineae bacterium]